MIVGNILGVTGLLIIINNKLSGDDTDSDCDSNYDATGVVATVDDAIGDYGTGYDAYDDATVEVDTGDDAYGDDVTDATTDYATVDDATGLPVASPTVVISLMMLTCAWWSLSHSGVSPADSSRSSRVRSFSESFSSSWDEELLEMYVL